MKATTLLISALLLSVAGPGAARRASANPPPPPPNMVAPVRLMTYNTALMNLEANLQSAIPPFASKTISIDTNSAGFGAQPYSQRVALMSDYIKQDDADIVVLNEVWNGAEKDTFVEELAVNGPYTHYIRMIKGKPPGFLNPFAAPGAGTNIDLLAASVAPGTVPGIAAANVVGSFMCAQDPGVCFLLPLAGIDVQFQDAGIMLFSKHPFVKFDANTWQSHPNVEVEGANGLNIPFGGGPKEVTAVVYTGARGMDQLAAKAAGIVRVQTGPITVVDVIFSHTNADETGPEENADVRAFQMNQVKKALLRSLTKHELLTEQVFMLGDLNTPGSNKVLGLTGEWSNLFGKNAINGGSKNPGVFFACGNGPCSAPHGQKFKPNGTYMTDSWGFETSVLDRSDTNYLDGQYYDYVLHNRAERQCMQYIRIGSEMVDGPDGIQLSDHMPIHVDFNLAAPRCSPNDDDQNHPEIVQPTTKKPVWTFTENELARLQHPGSFQWYKLPDPGTYWINVTTNAAHVAFDVYAATNLSEPIPAYHGEVDGRKGRRYVSDEPLYVRVYAVDGSGKPDRTWTGGYTIRFQRAMGVTPDDSIGLLPAVRTPYEWVSFLPGQKRVWFDFYTNKALSGAFADSTISNETSFFGNWQGASDFTNSLYAYSGVGDPANPVNYAAIDITCAQCANPNGTFPSVPDPNLQGVTGWNVEMPGLKGAAGGKPRKYWYVLDDHGTFGTPPPQNGLSTYLTFLTDLTYLRPVAMQNQVPVVDENEAVELSFQMDGKPDFCATVPGLAGCTWTIMTSPTPVPLPIIPKFTGPFVKEAFPTAYAEHGPLPKVGLFKLGDPAPGSEAHPIGLGRGEKGNPNCRVNHNEQLHKACFDMQLMYPDFYDYHLYYRVVHDLPYGE